MRVESRKEILAAIRQNAREGEPLVIETDRGTVSVTPRRSKIEQCYWEVHAGSVARARGAAGWSTYGGALGAGVRLTNVSIE